MLSDAVMASRLLEVYEERRDVRERQMCAIGCEIACQLDWCAYTGIDEDARVRIVERREAALDEPREQHALEAAACLLDPVDRLDDLGDERHAVLVELGVAGGQVAVDLLAVEEAPL